MRTATNQRKEREKGKGKGKGKGKKENEAQERTDTEKHTKLLLLKRLSPSGPTLRAGASMDKSQCSTAGMWREQQGKLPVGAQSIPIILDANQRF